MRHCGSSNIDNHYSHLRRIQRDFDWCYWRFNKIFIYRQVSSTISKMTKETFGEMKPLLSRILLKITSSWYRTKSKATNGVKNTASYIPWLYTTCDQMLTSNMIHYVLFLTTTTMIQAFRIKFKQGLLIILKLITHI